MGGLFGGSQKTGSTTQKLDKDTRNFRKAGMNMATDLLEGGQGYTPYLKGMATPLNAYTRSGMNAMNNLGKGNVGQSLQNQAWGIVKTGGFNKPQQNAMNSMYNLMRGDGKVDNSYFKDIYERAGTGEGSALDRIIASSQDTAQNRLNNQAAAAGRYGGAVHQGKVAESLMDIEARNRLDQFNRGIQQQLSAATGIAGVDTGNVNRMQDAAGQFFNMGQRGQQNLGNIYQTALQPAQTQLQVGDIQQDYDTRLIQDQYRQFQEQDMQDWNRLSAFASLFGGGTGGGSTTTTSQPRSYGGAIGNALWAGSQTGWNPLAMAAGGISGLI